MEGKTYAEKLKDPRWQKKRLEVLERDGWQCKRCGDRETTLHVHHIQYRSGEPWDTPASMLVTLCELCHGEEETRHQGMLRDLVLVLGRCGIRSSQDVAQLLGLYAIQGWGKFREDESGLENLSEDDNCAILVEALTNFPVCRRSSGESWFAK